MKTVHESGSSPPMGFVADLPDRAILDEFQRTPALFTALKCVRPDFDTLIVAILHRSLQKLQNDLGHGVFFTAGGNVAAGAGQLMQLRTGEPGHFP